MGGGGGGVETSNKGRKGHHLRSAEGAVLRRVLSVDTPHKQNVCHFSLVLMEKTNLA